MSRTSQFCVWLFLLGSLSCSQSTAVDFSPEEDARSSAEFTFRLEGNRDFWSSIRSRSNHPLRFNCGNGHSVYKLFLCDGDDDCRNGADERNCSHPRFDCGNGLSVPKRVLCDGDDDCRNRADERNCSHDSTKSATASPEISDSMRIFRFRHLLPSIPDSTTSPTASPEISEEGTSRPGGLTFSQNGDFWNMRRTRLNYLLLRFDCGNGQSVPKSFLCDRDNDCGNGADERNCSLERFDCGNGRSVHSMVLCDGDDDCGDGADERNCSHDSTTRTTAATTTTATTRTPSPEISVPPCLSLFLFDCGNGRLVRRTVVCNGNDDCGNRADERTCTRPSGFIPIQTPLTRFTGNTSLNLKKEEDIRSPRYPEDYPHNLNLLWNVTTVPGHRMKVVFNDFELEDSNNCTADFLKFYDGRDISSATLGTYCRHDGTQHAPVESSSNALIVHFQSDFSVAWRGFDLSLSTVCGGNLQAQTDENSLVSHTTFGDDIYGANVSCDWIIRSRTERNVQVTFSDFEVEKDLVMTDTDDVEVTNCADSVSGNCVQYNEPQDYVEIFDGPDATSTRIGKYFGNRLPPTITSRAEEILLRFRSGHQGNSRGFRATYKEV